MSGLVYDTAPSERAAFALQRAYRTVCGEARFSGMVSGNREWNIQVEVHQRRKLLLSSSFPPDFRASLAAALDAVREETLSSLDQAVVIPIHGPGSDRDPFAEGPVVSWCVSGCGAPAIFPTQAAAEVEAVRRAGSVGTPTPAHHQEVFEFLLQGA